MVCQRRPDCVPLALPDLFTSDDSLTTITRRTRHPGNEGALHKVRCGADLDIDEFSELVADLRDVSVTGGLAMDCHCGVTPSECVYQVWYAVKKDCVGHVHAAYNVADGALAWPIPAQLASTCARPRLIVFAGRLAGATAALFLSSPGPVFFPRSRRFDSLFSQVDTFRDISWQLVRNGRECSYEIVD